MAGNTLNAHVGPVFAGDGYPPFDKRLDNHGAAVVTEAGGKYKEPTKRGLVYCACTATTGVAPGTALGTIAAFCLYNPAGSGKRLCLQKVGMGLISGTMGGGTLWITGSAAGDAVPTGTAIAPKNRDIGGSNSSVAQPFTTATVTSQAGRQIDILATITEEVVATTAGPTEITEKDVDGEICIEPGAYICFHAQAAAGTSPLVVFKASWEEEGIAA